MERKIYLYTISNSYINYLQQFDTKISLHNSTQGSVYVGAVLEISNDVSYFVPLTSYSKKNPLKEPEWDIMLRKTESSTRVYVI